MSKNQKILIVEGRFYRDIADSLADGMVNEIQKAGFDYERIPVPGAFEVPTAILMAMKSTKLADVTQYAGYIASGCVIRGETDHYEYICRETSRAIMNISTDYGVAVGFGILTCENLEQAVERASPAKKNKGGDAAKACLRLIELQEYFKLIK
ncbi:MAG: 6,7-dimethyl-8-ribityllumazine synthase 1 [Alphaproteobacteria bacterium MarineAlpha3_Bin5]|nr:6,7-dimethyl-8-ribityllumazine synthase [Magnetovibrio sp.]PPR78615.1 MAG: 6,7-dimethyl-8-ribityllumazine synthase 1 [Alphaproteobacteria bacterium MarineAlpha3_Bin5]